MSFDLRGLKAQFPLLKTEVKGGPLRYLDNASTTPMPQAVLDALFDFESGARSNVSRAGHQLAARATDAYEQARAEVARYLNASDSDIIFTSGATAAINLLAHSLGSTLKPGDEVLLSLAEHHSNFIPWQMLRDRRGIVVKIIPLLPDGRLDLDTLDEFVSERCKLIALTHVSNVTGAVTDVPRVVAAADKVGAQILLDGAQAVAHGSQDVQALGVDYYAFSGHKCFGPTGVGVLWVKDLESDKLPPFMGGGGMVARVNLAENHYVSGSRRYEAGTPPVAQAVGLGAALNWLMAMSTEALRDYESRLTRQLLASLEGIEGLRIIGPANIDNRLPLVSFDIEGAHPHDICHLLDQEGLALRGGHHCAQPLMDHFDLMATSRASLAFYNTEEDIEALAAGLKKAIEILL